MGSRLRFVDMTSTNFNDANLGEEGEVEGEEGEVEEAGQDRQHGHLPSKYVVMIVQSYDVVIMRMMMMRMMTMKNEKILTLVVKSASSCLSDKDLFGNRRQKSWIIVIVIFIFIIIFIIISQRLAW